MRNRLLTYVSSVVLLFAECAPPLQAQAQTPQPVSAAPSPNQAQGFSTEQLDALLAPIALYPDTLLTQTLMAATYPQQVADAARWVEVPANKALTRCRQASSLSRFSGNGTSSSSAMSSTLRQKA